MKCALVTVVSGDVYWRYAQDLFRSAREHFPSDLVLLTGREGWPAATLYRYHVLLEHDLSAYDYIYLCDADMRWEGPPGAGVFSPLVATQHPGYVGKKDLPYEKRVFSAAYVQRGDTYYAGGFVGGEREPFLDMARRITAQINMDDSRGVTALWHDESHLNRHLAEYPPTVTLSPSYCYPDDASAYPWLNGTKRILVALDKTPAERGER